MSCVNMDRDANNNRYYDTDRFLCYPGPLTSPDFEPSQELAEFVRDNVRVLVVGAGGLGCELLKDLALMGFHNMDVIDMDTIDASNLNRQFLFRPGDVGKDKATTAANFVNKRVAGAKVTPHFCKIQDYDEDFYREFHVVVCGLDSIDARRWLNSMLCSLVEFDDDGNVRPETVKPFIDGGTEGFKGQVRVMYPMMTCCFECTLPMFPPQVNFPLCTIASTPRQPEHCIEWAKLLEWPKHFPDREPDCDIPTDVTWLYEQAKIRAEEFGIEGVTMRLTLGVAKRIIPAIASTNAVIAAACANETFKVVTQSSKWLKNYMMYTGSTGVYTFSFEHERDPSCIVCNRESYKMDVNFASSLKSLLEMFEADERLRLKGPVIRCNNKTIYTAKPLGQTMEKLVETNITKTLAELGFSHGTILDVSDKSLVQTMQIQLRTASA